MASAADRAARRDLTVSRSASIPSRDSAGGPAREAVEAALADAREEIEADRETVESRRAALAAADAELRSEVAAYV